MGQASSLAKNATIKGLITDCRLSGAAIQQGGAVLLEMTDVAVVVLAAGLGTRMKSAIPKVLHKVGNRTLMGHALATAAELQPARAVVVHGPGMEKIQSESLKFMPTASFAEQTERNGTGHAVSMAKDALKSFHGTVLVLYGDVPLIQKDSLQKLLAKIDASHPMAVLGFVTGTPKGYGRLITRHDRTIAAIREELDASPEEREINLCNSGIIAIDAALLWDLIPKLGSNNAKGELYLTDLVELVNSAKKKVALEICDEDEVQGVNDRNQLAGMEARFQSRKRIQAMTGGATLIDPGSTFFSADTRIGTDVVIEPNVIFGPGVKIGKNVEIFGHSHIEGATIADGARVGPFARLRPGAEIGENAHIGNYVEIKKATIGKGAKVNHLTYIGDAIVGAGSNIGAGTITCNYDGYEKHLTDIGENVFIGSNSALVAPVKIGNGANIAAGSVITKSIPEDALALSRPELQIREGWAKTYRAIKAAKKAKKKV
jgi:bifunctional UDP-N-acetylglucosamine pyrophosphorylase/glucosamine-1-phosphate N-acetyltransferase